MKLSTTNPDYIEQFQGEVVGIWPIRRNIDGRNILIIKSPKEFAQTARLRRKFYIYLAPINVENMATFGLITAFLDDFDEPLIIRTPLYNDELTQDYFSILKTKSIYVHFFDSFNQELLGFRVENLNSDQFRMRSNNKQLLLPPNPELAPKIDNALQKWFGNRLQSDDNEAFEFKLQERLFPDVLEDSENNPGDIDEADIALSISRVFRSDQVFQNPLRADNKLEFVDILVVTPNTILLIQAKDSPINESALNRNITRKSKINLKHLKKAARQLKGSINYLKSSKSLEIIINNKRQKFSTHDKRVFGIVVVKEKFDNDQNNFSSPIFDLIEETKTPCIALDHAEIQQFTILRTTEESFMEALKEILHLSKTHGVFPRIRMGFVTGKSVVSSLYEAPTKTETCLELLDKSIVESDNIPTNLQSEQTETNYAAEIYLFKESGTNYNIDVIRTDVEAIDITRTAVLLSRLLADRNSVERYKGCLELSFDGYNSDPRELYEIPEVRKFCSKLDQSFPYWFYFLATNSLTLLVIAGCLCTVTRVKPDKIKFESEDLIEFLERHYCAQNWLFENYSLDENLNYEISMDIAKLFQPNISISHDVTANLNSNQGI